MHPTVGGCTTSTDRDCGATDSEKEHFFAVVGDSVCDSSETSMIVLWLAIGAVLARAWVRVSAVNSEKEGV